MNCEKVKAQLSTYLDGEVTGKEACFITEHIAVCDDCSQEEQLLRKSSELLKHWENPPVPDGFCEALLARAENESRQPRRTIINAVRPLAGPRARIKMAFCGAVVLLMCIGIVLFTRPSLKKAPMVEPLPSIVEFPRQNVDEAAQGSENSIRYTTMAEIKIAGMWR